MRRQIQLKLDARDRQPMNGRYAAPNIPVPVQWQARRGRYGSDNKPANRY